MILVTTAFLILFSCGSDDSCEPPDPTENPIVVIETTLGDITVELYPLNSPITVGNFLNYVHESFYNGLIFHRVIKNFMIQGGGLDESMLKKTPTHGPIPNEANNGLSNLLGTIAMARTADPHSATCQFFINVNDNKPLDYRDETPGGWGYCVFGKVIGGMDVVDAIRSVETTQRNGYTDVPVEPIIISRIYRKH
ncbi:MAG: peptidyl-prolyl cis-trans isomerase [Candidatus Latescibacterota bacterium]|nr:MAG: peptidyl-prolyl cis-trans isomerase [Candidatus Latescibacterota bacterium]